MDRKRVGFLGYEGVMALDLTGPIDAFTTAAIDGTDGVTAPCYEVVIIGLGGKAFASESGIVFKPHTTILKAPALDTLIIPGGRGLRNPDTLKIVSSWIRTRAPRIRRIASVCTGAYALAASGLLDGRKVTTHWRHAHDLSKRFPQLSVNSDALYLRDGAFYTCAGVTSGIDLSLALIEEDFGPRVALAVARELVVYFKRPGGQEQFSEPLRFQTQVTNPFADLATWIQGHLSQDLSVGALAKRAFLSPRQFSRRFKEIFECTPMNYVEEQRLTLARERLTVPSRSIEAIAGSVGFTSPDAFRRAFERRFGVNPSTFRRHFNLGSNGLLGKSH
jgi:transcriptional regulator GlxA family with amidase domain